MSHSDAAWPAAEVRPDYFTLLIANCALPSASNPEHASDWLATRARAALRAAARPVVVVLPARGGVDLRALAALDVWIVRDDGSSTIDAALRVVGEALDDIPRRFAGALLVLASSPPLAPDSSARLVAKSTISAEGLASADGRWPIAATRDALVEMATRGVERTLRMRATAQALELVEQCRSWQACDGGDGVGSV